MLVGSLGTDPWTGRTRIAAGRSASAPAYSPVAPSTASRRRSAWPT